MTIVIHIRRAKNHPITEFSITGGVAIADYQRLHYFL
jgi:hypothetical protein